MSQELEPIDQYGQEMEQVVNELLKGELNATNISRTTGIKRAQVVEYIAAWKMIAQNDKSIQARARENLVEMDKHYSLIMKEQWALVDDMETPRAVKATLLKNIADVEKARQDTLQKAGYYDNTGIADEVVKMEELATKIKEFLKEVTKKYPETTVFIMEGIKKIYNEEPTIEGEVIA
jgi:hypothetical protein